MRAEAAGSVVVLRHIHLRAALRELAQRGIQRVLLEGGGRTLGQAFDHRLVREVVFYIAPLLAGGKVPAVGALGVKDARQAWELADLQTRNIGDCLRLSGRLEA